MLLTGTRPFDGASAVLRYVLVNVWSPHCKTFSWNNRCVIGVVLRWQHGKGSATKREGQRVDFTLVWGGTLDSVIVHLCSRIIWESIKPPGWLDKRDAKRKLQNHIFKRGHQLLGGGSRLCLLALVDSASFFLSFPFFPFLSASLSLSLSESWKLNDWVCSGWPPRLIM